MTQETDAVPVVVDVTFKISEQGDIFAMEFGCRDGSVKSVALTTAALLKILAGAMWTAAEAAQRRPVPAISERMREHIRANAPQATLREAIYHPNGPVMEFQVGAAPLAIQLSRKASLELAERLVDALQPPPGQA